MGGFGELLRDLREAGVEFVLVGGIAVIRHGVVRATRDIDALVESSTANTQRLADLAARWSATRPDGSPLPDGWIAPGRVLNLATRHGAIDFLPELTPPLTYAALLERADVKRVDGVEAPVCSLADLVALKRIAGREQDLADLAALAVAHGVLPDIRDSA